jgi:UDP-N-acetylglucosamine diphosphorylase/glucosamine-1-phosphate N-acetyltransferase
MSISQAVILAAGEGKRMHPLTSTRPKVMLPMANKPILEHLIIEMKEAGIHDFTFIVGFHDEQIRNYFSGGQKWQVNISYCPQNIQLGTADAVRMVEGSVNGSFLLANGDIIVQKKDIERLLQIKGCSMTVVELPVVTGLGVIEAKEGFVAKIYEKMESPPSHLANAGLYLFTPEIFAAIASTAKSPRGEFEITDSIQHLIDSGQKVGYLEIEKWLDLSYPWDLLSANERIMSSLMGQNLGTVEPNVSLQGAISIGQGTVIRSGAYIVGPTIIGDNCDIGPNCFIRPSTAIADHCHIGAGVEIKNSIIMSRSKIPHLSYVGDSIIGEDCNLGAGTKIANLKLDKRNISISNIDTKRRKLGAIIGDNVQTGINSSINVGTVIGPGSFIGPGALAHGVIAPKSKIFGNR